MSDWLVLLLGLFLGVGLPFLAAYFAACVGAQRLLTFREWWGPWRR